MSVSRPSQCLFCTFSRALKRAPPARRKFHASSIQLQRKPKYPNIKASELPAVTDISKTGDYSKEDRSNLSKHYSPEQLAAIEAAENTISGAELESSTLRADPWSLDYFDEFTEIDPVADKPVRAPWTHIDPKLRLKDDDELDADLAGFLRKFPTDENKAGNAWQEFSDNLRLTVGKEEAERHPRTALAPDLGSMSGKAPVPKRKDRRDPQAVQQEEPSPALVRLMQMTGYDRRQIASLRVKSIITHRVVNQTRLGKIGKQYFLSIAGNGNGLIGIGEGKSEEPTEARLQSQYRAIRNMQPILRYENRTIYGDVKGKVSATELELYARPPGFGLRCQQYIWEVCKCAGISDLAARVTRSRNPMNTVKATVAALVSQKDPEDIARARGKKMVDVRKVYYAGMV